jgi:LysM repeat protein
LKKKTLPHLLLLAILLFVILPAGPILAAVEQEGALEYKNYIIRYDRGWDILCEPYQVKRNDWVLKIFRQKGEIAHNDFREFMGIFKRLNPHIKDINLILPGQHVDIPLKKLQQGTLPGQATGVVTIPFVTITDVADLISSSSSEYVVRKGDVVSRLVAKRFGDYGTKEYKQGLKMFAAVNPHIKDLNKIYVGQKVYLPAPSVREQPWFESIFDAKGNIVQEIGPKPGLPMQAAVPQTFEATKIQVAADQGPFAQAADALEGKLYNKGTYYLPVSGRKDLELDLSSFPVIELKNRKRFILSQEEEIMDFSPKALESILPPDASVVPIPKDPTVLQILKAMAAKQKGDGKSTQSRISFSSHGVEVQILAQWIETLPAEGDDKPRHICIIPISTSEESTPESIYRFLDQHNIVLREILSDESPVRDMRKAESPTNRYLVQQSLATANQKTFVAELVKTLGYHYSPNTKISFPYAGIQVDAWSNLISSGQGDEILVDFGDLYGDAVDAIQKTGLRVVRIGIEETPFGIVKKLLEEMRADFTENPTFLAARRSSEYNTAITIRGFLCANAKNEPILLASASLHQGVTDFLKGNGMQVVMIGSSQQFY